MANEDFESFFRKNENTVYRIVKGYIFSRDTAKDIVIETMMKVYERWDKIREFENATGYTVRIAINLAKKYLTDRKLKGLFSLDEDAINNIPAWGNPEDIVMTAEETRKIEEELGQLKEIERNVILLKDVDKMKFEEIAGVLSQKLPTVKSHYRRGKIKLAKRLEIVMPFDEV
jgi:RNA polymerase sigma-70 factor (ECF subfamily)